MSAAKPAEVAKTPKKAGTLKVLLIGIVAIVILGGAGGGFFWWKSRQASAATHDTAGSGESGAEHGHGQSAEVSGALPFEPFIVNLADPGSSHYLKADLRLLVSGVEDMKELEEDKVTMLRLRSTILEYLSQQSAEALVTPEGKEALKKELAERCTKVLGHAKVQDVLFAEFVVQF